MRNEKKKSGEVMMAASPFHIDESFWYFVVALLAYRGDFWAVGFMLAEPLLTHLLCKKIAKPGDATNACNNMIPVDLRKEFSTPPEVLETIKGGNMVEAVETDRPNSKWVGVFSTSLAPDSMDHLDKSQQRLVYVLSQGGGYLPKASNPALVMICYSMSIAGLTLTRYDWHTAAKFIVITNTHINLMHILRDHSVSGLTHHGAHNVGEFDKVEFIKGMMKTSLPVVVASAFLDGGSRLGGAVQMFAGILSLKCCAFANHTLTHYNRNDIKGKGGVAGKLWHLALDAQELLGRAKIVTSKQYHAAHHFHNEMAYPAILITVNEYLNAKSLSVFLTMTMDGKDLCRIEKILNGFFIIMLYAAVVGL